MKSFNHKKECEYCKLAKSTRSSFTKTVLRCADVGHQWYVVVRGPNGTSKSAVGIGNIRILKDVLYIPNIPKSSISATAFCNNGYSMFQSKKES